MNILWIILIGFVAGIIAKLLAPGPNNPAGFILTTVSRYCGRILGDVHRADDWLVSSRSRRWTHRATVGALIVLFIWHQVVSRRSV